MRSYQIHRVYTLLNIYEIIKLITYELDTNCLG